MNDESLPIYPLYPLNSTEYWVHTKLELALAYAKKGKWNSCFIETLAAHDYLLASGLCLKEGENAHE